jgi:hypothetical protein
MWFWAQEWLRSTALDTICLTSSTCAIKWLYSSVQNLIYAQFYFKFEFEVPTAVNDSCSALYLLFALILYLEVWGCKFLWNLE